MRRVGRALGLVAAAALALVVLRLALPDPLTDRIERALLDLRFQLRGPVAPPDEIVILAVDEESLSAFGGPVGVRAALARAIREVSAAGARVVAIDLLMPARTPADAQLAAALAGVGAGAAILAVALTPDPAAAAPRIEPEQVLALERSVIPVVVDGVSGAPAGRAPEGALLMPNPELAMSGRLAHVNILRAPDGVARRAALALRLPEGHLPALPVAAAARARGVGPEAVVLWPGRQLAIGPAEFAFDRDGNVTINHYGPAGSFPRIGLAAAATGTAPAGAFAGRIVLVGATADSLGDLFATPFSSDLAGVEVLATLTANLLEGSFIRRDGVAALATLGVALAGAALACLAALPRSLVLAVAGSLTAWAAALAATQAAFALHGLWLDATAVAGSLASGSATGTFLRDRAERRRAMRLGRERANIARFLPAALADELAGDARPRFDRRRQQAAVLFVDLEGYTARMEALDPVSVAEFLAGLHRLFEDCAHAHGGVVTDFAGDGAMIVFGMPDPAPRDAANAVACGEALIAGAAELRHLGAPEAGGLRLRVSIHHGPVAAAVLGGPRQAHATVTGDTVNLASRLQETAKAHGEMLVVSRATLDAAAATDAGIAGRFRFLARVTPRGRRQEIEVWSRTG